MDFDFEPEEQAPAGHKPQAAPEDPAAATMRRLPGRCRWTGRIFSGPAIRNRPLPLRRPRP